jgi:flagellar protein FliT
MFFLDFTSAVALRAAQRAARRRDAGIHAARLANPKPETTQMNTNLLSFYEAIEQASADMLNAARDGNWDEVVKLEGACVLLISQLKAAAREAPLSDDAAKAKSRIMQRILVNDAEIRNLAEPWLVELEQTMSSKPQRLH